MYSFFSSGKLTCCNGLTCSEDLPFNGARLRNGKADTLTDLLTVSQEYFTRQPALAEAFPTAWSRVNSVIDVESPFVCLMSAVKSDPLHLDSPSANVLIGLGWVQSRLCLFVAHEPTRAAGAMSSGAIKKILRAQKIALMQRLPVIYLVESAGLDLANQAEGFVDIGGVFANMAKLSQAGVPQASVCYGTATAGGAYLVGLADFTIFLSESARVFLAGPNLVNYAIGERTTAEQLGGAAVHQASGLADSVVVTEPEIAPQIARWLSQQRLWPVCKPTILPLSSQLDDQTSQVLSEISGDYRRMFITPELLATFLDEGFQEYKSAQQDSMMCFFAAIAGSPIGVIANKGPIDAAAACKTAQFIERCSIASMPLLFVMHTTGFQVGRQAEMSGIIAAGSRLIQAVTNAPVPKITLQVGGAFGAGYYAMCGRPFGADVVLSWPTAKLAVMGPEPGAQLWTSLRVASAKKRGVSLSAEEKKRCYAEVYADFSEKMAIDYTSSQLWDDGVIAPENTRAVVSLWLDIFRYRQLVPVQASAFGLSRVG